MKLLNSSNVQPKPRCKNESRELSAGTGVLTRGEGSVVLPWVCVQIGLGGGRQASYSGLLASADVSENDSLTRNGSVLVLLAWTEQ